MQLTLYSDYSLRVLLYLSQTPKKIATILEIANFYKISKNHLVKVAHRLAQLGFIKTQQGHGGGLQLVYASLELTVAEIIKKTETNFHLVECFNKEKNNCIISPHCIIQKILFQAMQAFFTILENYRLKDLSNSLLTQQINLFLDSTHRA
ncbi:Rrf2 family transcriptional regulator [Rickettsiella endosymbiont of Rhagonycha lignosa]|uniref:RrF2 family transcriptional regulator n=1 Tax=Rickettsiella endosymbiont of Rhagonycha lignosa TaxID=3077937 RepID=UPI00313C2421